MENQKACLESVDFRPVPLRGPATASPTAFQGASCLSIYKKAIPLGLAQGRFELESELFPLNRRQKGRAGQLSRKDHHRLSTHPVVHRSFANEAQRIGFGGRMGIIVHFSRTHDVNLGCGMTFGA